MESEQDQWQNHRESVKESQQGITLKHFIRYCTAKPHSNLVGTATLLIVDRTLLVPCVTHRTLPVLRQPFLCLPILDPSELDLSQKIFLVSHKNYCVVKITLLDIVTKQWFSRVKEKGEFYFKKTKKKHISDSKRGSFLRHRLPKEKCL